MDWVQKGKVSVNGEIVLEPSFAVDPQKDKVCVNGKRITEKAYQYLMLNKPSGYLTTKADPHAAKTIYQLLPRRFRILAPVGRLDKLSEGLLILTNDGGVAHKLTHPRYNIQKDYQVRLAGRLSPPERMKVERGVYLDGKRTAKAKIRVLKTKKDFTDCVITIHEGRKRQVRRMFAAVRHKVIYLKRVSQGPLRLTGLKVGAWRPLNAREKEKLYQL